MVLFITSIRHPRNAHSYQKVGEILERTLASVCRQSNENYKVLVVCNETPKIQFKHEKIIFLETPLPAPSQLQRPDTGRKVSRLDKGCKYYIGIQYAQQFQPDYIMFFDADDLIHQDIVQFLENKKPENGWFFNDGFVVHASYPIFKKQHPFYQVCGTSFIFHNKILLAFLKDFQFKDHYDILEQTDSFFITNVLGAHIETREYFEKRGTPLSAFPFPAAMWVVDTGENHSGQQFLNLPGTTEVITAEMEENFGISDTSSKLSKKIELLKFHLTSIYLRIIRKLSSKSHIIL